MRTKSEALASEDVVDCPHRAKYLRGIVRVIHMKSLASRIHGALALGAVTAIGIPVRWSQAFAQHPGAVPVPEPSSLALMATEVVVLATFNKFRKRN
jgi:hypothetical protein